MGDWLDGLMRAHKGLVEPADLVNDAQPKQSPMHDCFEWDDTAAGEQYRLHQAGEMCRVVVVIRPELQTDPDGPPIEVRQTISIKHPEKESPARCYVLVSQLMKTPAGREVALADALRELNACKRKYAYLKELAGVFEALAEAERKVA